MEPAAPGTEDEVVAQPTTFTKKETEQDRLLSIRAHLPNGKYGNVFELNFVYGAESWYCNLCQCPIMGQVYHHEIGKRHTNNTQHSSSSGSGGYRASSGEADAPELDVQIVPGQPVPPGFEGAIEKVAQIQERLGSFTTSPLIGLEYLFELQEYDRDKEPCYLCLLCDKRGDPRTVIAHLASYNHITQYLQRHFISCFRALSPYITKQYKRNWQLTMHKIAEAIETKFGRLKPHVVERDIFERNRSYYQNIVATGMHFNEKTGVTFEELVVKEELTRAVDDEIIFKSGDSLKRIYRKTGSEIEVVDVGKKSKRSPSPPVVAKPKKPKPAPVTLAGKRRSLSSVSSISSSDLSDFEPDNNEVKVIRKDKIVKRSPPLRSKDNAQKHRPRERSRSPSYRRDRIRERSYDRSLMPWQRSDYIRSRDVNVKFERRVKTDKMEEFKRLAVAIEKDMERVLKQHEKNPEKHPQYNDEWKKFWNKRYKELQVEGKDAATYDFKPEWIEYWNERLKELHGMEVKSKKDALRKRLGIPEDPPRISFKIGNKKQSSQSSGESTSNKPAPIASAPDQDPDIIIIDDKDSVGSRRSHSPWESESGSRPQSRRSHEKSRERSRDRSVERSTSRVSRDPSRERSHRRNRSISPAYSRSSRSLKRERGDRGDYLYRADKYSRHTYKKSDELPDYIQPPRIMRDVTRHPVRSPPPTYPVAKEPEVIFDDNEDLNIVGVLRLLTALEDKLGSLGPKVVNLLSQALAMEKTEANSSEMLLDNDINCVMFETVKEKLKGQLLAGFVTSNQEKAIKHAIKKIASLIHFANERSREREKEKPKEDPISVPGVGTVDKTAIAKQIATALINQGKTDVSQSELEHLINAVVGMAEASKSSNKPMTTALFLEKLSSNSQQLNEPKLKNESLTDVLNSTKQELNSSNNMEGLSDSDLQTLLQNFKDLCNEEQHSLISYLKKLEAKEPERVERLRKFVNLDSNGSGVDSIENIQETSRSSPFSNRMAGLNPTVDDSIITFEDDDEAFIEKKEDEKKEEVNTIKVLDSEDEDYSFEDVVKAAQQNVTAANEENEKLSKVGSSGIFKTEDFDFSNAKSIIANIMGQIKNSANTWSVNLLGMHDAKKTNEGDSFFSTLSQNSHQEPSPGEFNDERLFDKQNVFPGGVVGEQQQSQNHASSIFGNNNQYQQQQQQGFSRQSHPSMVPPVTNFASSSGAPNYPNSSQHPMRPAAAASLPPSQYHPPYQPTASTVSHHDRLTPASANFQQQGNVSYPIHNQFRNQAPPFREREFFNQQQQQQQQIRGNMPGPRHPVANRNQLPQQQQLHPSYDNYNSRW